MSEMTGRITYEGPPALANMLVQHLDEEGVHVDWQPPELPDERLSYSVEVVSIANEVVVTMTVSGTTAAIELAVRKFRERVKGQGSARIDYQDLEDQEN
jgi:hypothetical protein